MVKFWLSKNEEGVSYSLATVCYCFPSSSGLAFMLASCYSAQHCGHPSLLLLSGQAGPPASLRKHGDPEAFTEGRGQSGL